MTPSAKILSAAILAASILSAPSPATALSCVPPVAPEDALERVDLVFTGTAVEPSDEDATRFRVKDAHLGTPGDYVTVRTPGHPWAFEYEIGQTAVVAANLHDGAFYTGPCEVVEGGPGALAAWLERR